MIPNNIPPALVLHFAAISRCSFAKGQQCSAVLFSSLVKEVQQDVLKFYLNFTETFSSDFSHYF